jgi:hypothetical protein
MKGCFAGAAAVLVLALLTQVAGAADAWKHAEAVCRLRVCASSPYAQQVRVDLPESLTTVVKGVAAYAADATPVAAAPVALGERTVSVWLALGRQPQAALAPGEEGLQLPVEVYLFAEPKIPTPLADAARLPARLLRTARALTTRPFTAREALLLLGSLLDSGRPPYATDAPGLGVVPAQVGGEGAGGRQSLLQFWSSVLTIEAPAHATFGSDSIQAAWFLSIDGRPVADWRQVTADGKGRFWAKEVDLDPGLHTAEFFVIQRHDEPLPACLWKLDGGEPGALTGSCPPIHPEAVEVQLGADQPAVGIRLAKVSRTYSEDTGADVLCFTPMTAAGAALPPDAVIALDGQALDPTRAGQGCLVPAPRLPAVDLRLPGSSAPPLEVRLPARPVWVLPARTAGRCQVAGVPAVLAAAEPLTVEAEVGFPGADLDPRLLSGVSVSARQVDAGGKTLRQQSLGTGGGPGRHTAALELAPNAARVLVEACAGGALLAPAVPIRVLHAGSDLRGLEAWGQGLAQAGDRVVLSCRPLEPLRPDRQRPPRASWTRLGIVDDLCTIVDAPGASLLPERVIGKAWPEPPVIFRESIRADADAGALPTVAKFAALQHLLEMRLDAVILSVGAADLRRGRTGREISQDLLFMAQATAAAGTVPVLLALPPLPGVPPETSRQAALLCKELAWQLDIPVIDAHSGEHLNVLPTETFADTFSAAAGQVALSGPGDRGREWLYGLMDRAIVDLGKARGP